MFLAVGYRRDEQLSKLTPFHEAFKLALKADARRPRHERRMAKARYAEIKAAGYGGGYTRVTDFVFLLKGRNAKNINDLRGPGQ